VRARHARLLIAGTLVVSIAVPVLLAGMPAITDLGALGPRSLAPILALTLSSWLARAAKLWTLTRRLDIALPARDALAVSLATDFAFLTTPGGVGGYAANILLLRRAGATTSAATAVAAADQIVDAAFFAIALPIAALLAVGSAAPPALVRIALVCGGGLFVAATAAIVLRRALARVLARAMSAIAPRSRHIAALRELLTRAADETAQLLSGDPRYAAAIAGFTAVQWITRYGVLWAALIAFGHDVPYAIVMLAQALVMHAAQWSGVPAGAGAAELGLAAALAPWLSSAAFAPAAIVWRLASLHLAVLAGGVALLRLVRHSDVPTSRQPALSRHA
jgi:uncharacterized protein (TIRG00374 family)